MKPQVKTIFLPDYLVKVKSIFNQSRDKFLAVRKRDFEQPDFAHTVTATFGSEKNLDFFCYLWNFLWLFLWNLL